ncbi:MAG: response regulator, partial [Opitutaceae bacterium]
MSASAQAKTVFIVDDDEGLLILMTEALRAEGYEVFSAKSGAAALDWLRGNAADLMLLDLKLKDSAGPDLIQQLRRENITVPFVVVTGQGDEKVAVGVMKQGALDYVMKDTGLLDLLPAIVKRVFAAMERDRVLTALEKE